MFGRVGTKYRNKYRSLLHNIKDSKHELYRKMIVGEMSPIEIVLIFLLV